jgi:hypothetical protein
LPSTKMFGAVEKKPNCPTIKPQITKNCSFTSRQKNRDNSINIGLFSPVMG